LWVTVDARLDSSAARGPEVAIDLIFGAAVYRMAVGHGELTPDDADTIVDLVMRALAN